MHARFRGDTDAHMKRQADAACALPHLYTPGVHAVSTTDELFHDDVRLPHFDFFFLGVFRFGGRADVRILQFVDETKSAQTVSMQMIRFVFFVCPPGAMAPFPGESVPGSRNSPVHAE